ncbi:DUF6352 family protein [Roseomonas marmotae]|uniref:DUF1835 domain-containing protein n=1 Tax=Roseomonas marmotae TaxID=2768161 RepID=A0ABS3KDV1_9PROT|nr:DUF6352 family protein [Roseomonas marmotae]MBO1075110.1 hypothetical protein [Roseomonas marmotae]QTI79775.1 hypothetical protein IAI58_02940 [Roseomonas marmotae]
MTDFWIASGHQLCDRDAGGRLVATPDLWRAFLARPELVPPEEACEAERALHAALLRDPLQPVEPARLAALADPDAAENWQVFLHFRDRVMAQPTLEAAWIALYRGSVHGVPPLFLQMLTQLVTRAALEGVEDAFILRAGECLFRPQRAAIHQGALLLADEEVVEAAAREGDFGTLGRLLEEAGTPTRAVELDVLGDADPEAYAARSDAHDYALDIAEGRPGQHALARALERFIGHVMGEQVAIRPAAVIEDPNWSWHVGLDTEATAIANDLWHGKEVAQARLARIIWLGVLEFAEFSRVLPRASGHPVYLVLAMDAAQRLRVKPQNLLLGLPLLEAEAAS